jgi:hypothetical protein
MFFFPVIIETKIEKDVCCTNSEMR